MYDLIVIGGGPAALAATLYAREKNLHVVMVYEDLGGKVGWRESLVGGEPDQHLLLTARQQFIRERTPPQATPYLPANELVRVLINRIMQTGHVIHDRVLTLGRGLNFFSLELGAQGVLQSTAVLLATGAAPRPLEVPGAQRLVDRGLGYSITTYAQQARGLQVAVIGDSRRAVLGAAELAQVAAQVYLVTPTALPDATPLSAALLRQPNVEIVTGYAVQELIGQHELERIVLRRGPEIRTIAVRRAFADLGLQPNSGLLRGMAHLDERGFVVVDQRNATSLPGLFAAGDVTTTPGEQVLAAIGDGARAAMSAYEYCLSWRLAAAMTDSGD